MDSVRVQYAIRPDATPKAELAALAACYQLILDSHAKKEVPGPRQAGNFEDERKDPHALTNSDCT